MHLPPVIARRWKLSLGLLAAVVFVPSYLWFDYERGEGAWSRYRAEAMRRGVKLEMKDFIPPRISDEENYAAIPFFLRASREDTRSPLELPGLNEKSSTIRGQLEGRVKSFLEKGWLREDQITGNAAYDVSLGLERLEPVFSQVQAARERPKGQFSDYCTTGFLRVPTVAHWTKTTAEIYRLRLLAHLAAGDGNAALDDFRGAARLYQAMRHDPGLHFGRLRSTAFNTAHAAVQQGLREQLWALPELQALAEEFRQIDFLSDAAFAMASERSRLNALIDMSRAVPKFQRFKNFPAVKGEGIGGMMRSIHSIRDGWIYENLVLHNELMDWHSQAINLEARRVRFGGLVPGKQRRDSDRWYYYSALMLERFYEGYPAYAAYCDAAIQQTRIVCALERHRLATGSYPQILAALVPDYIEAIPHDVVDEEPMRYRLNPNGTFLLYSIGSNCRDDGGSSEPETADVLPLQQRDWVWGVQEVR